MWRLRGEQIYVQDFCGENWGKEPTWRNRSKWKDNIETELKEIEWEVVDCIHLAKDEDKWREPVNTVTILPVP